MEPYNEEEDIDPCEQGHDYDENGNCMNCVAYYEPDDFSGATPGDR